MTRRMLVWWTAVSVTMVASQLSPISAQAPPAPGPAGAGYTGPLAKEHALVLGGPAGFYQMATPTGTGTIFELGRESGLFDADIRTDVSWVTKGNAPHSLSHFAAIVAVKAAGNEATLRLVDGLPHTFFNRSTLDELAGPFRMDVRDHPKGGREVTRVDRAGVFDVARAFFASHLR